MALEDIAPRIGKAHREVKEELVKADYWVAWTEWCLRRYDPEPRRFSHPDHIYDRLRKKIERGELI